MFMFPSTSTYDSTNVIIQGTFGTSGADVLFGKDFAARFSWATWSYNDVLYGFGGPDKLFGGAGYDKLFGGTEDDFLSGGTEDDSLWGGEGADVLDGGSGFDLAMYDQATSGVGASLSNPSGNRGEAAGDTYNSIEGLVGSAFGDFLEGDFQRNELYGGDGQDFLNGQGNNDTLYGGDKGDTLVGHTGNDTIYGENGNDFIIGGAGIDILSGGADADTFIFNPGDTGFSPASGMDVITDFKSFEGDKIDLRGMMDRGPFYRPLDGLIFIGDFTPDNFWNTLLNNPGKGQVGFTQLGAQDYTIHIMTILDGDSDYSISVHTPSSTTPPDLSWFILS
jgi:Ca2+-binding RTX toxin-like protein